MAVTACTVQLRDIATIAREKVKAVIAAATQFAPAGVQDAIKEARGVISAEVYSVAELGEQRGDEATARGVPTRVEYPVKGVSAGSAGWMSSNEHGFEFEVPGSKAAGDGGGPGKGGGGTGDGGGGTGDDGGGAGDGGGGTGDGGGGTGDGGGGAGDDGGGSGNDGGGTGNDGAVGSAGTASGGVGVRDTSTPRRCSALLEGTVACRSMLANCLRFTFRVLGANVRRAQWELVVAAVDEMEKACKKVDNLLDRVRVAPPRQEIYVQPRVLAGVVNALRAPESRVVVVHGLPTLGKSSLAKEVICLSKSGVCCHSSAITALSLQEMACTRDNA